MTNAYTKPLPEIAHDLKEELKEFVATRLAMLRSEMSEKLSSCKAAMPAMVLGLVLLWTSWLLFTALLVTAIATAFSSPWGWVFAFLIVTGAYLLLGLMLAVGAWSKLKQTKLVPERTLRVLKQDEVWLQTEAKTQI
jgi:Putative Actinobacterial Holin-X, holin superfamily III